METSPFLVNQFLHVMSKNLIICSEPESEIAFAGLDPVGLNYNNNKEMIYKLIIYTCTILQSLQHVTFISLIILGYKTTDSYHFWTTEPVLKKIK